MIIDQEFYRDFKISVEYCRKTKQFSVKSKIVNISCYNNLNKSVEMVKQYIDGFYNETCTNAKEFTYLLNEYMIEPENDVPYIDVQIVELLIKKLKDNEK